MKVKVWHEPEPCEVEVNVTWKDIASAIAELQKREGKAAIGEVINAAYGVFDGLTAEQIEHFRPDARRIIANKLRQLADKFDVKAT